MCSVVYVCGGYRCPHSYPFSSICLLFQADPLDKVLTAFSSAMDVARERVKFVFDGDSVEPTSTAEELGLEDDDVIDARVITDD